MNVQTLLKGIVSYIFKKRIISISVKSYKSYFPVAQHTTLESTTRKRLVEHHLNLFFKLTNHLKDLITNLFKTKFKDFLLQKQFKL